MRIRALVLWLADLLHVTAAILQQVAKRLRGGSVFLSSNSLFKVLGKLEQAEPDRRLDRVEGTLGGCWIDCPEAGGQVAERYAQQSERPLRPREDVIGVAHVYRRHLERLEREEIALRSRLMKTDQTISGPRMQQIRGSL